MHAHRVNLYDTVLLYWWHLYITYITLNYSKHLAQKKSLVYTAPQNPAKYEDNTRHVHLFNHRVDTIPPVHQLDNLYILHNFIKMVTLIWSLVHKHFALTIHCEPPLIMQMTLNYHLDDALSSLLQAQYKRSSSHSLTHFQYHESHHHEHKLRNL
jgi:hypothetical protein